MGACCTMVTACRVADWLLCMMRLDAPMEVMVGTVSTLTEEEQRLRPWKHLESGSVCQTANPPLTSPFSCRSVLLTIVAG